MELFNSRDVVVVGWPRHISSKWLELPGHLRKGGPMAFASFMQFHVGDLDHIFAIHFCSGEA